MELLLQQVLAGLATGGIYALMALGMPLLTLQLAMQLSARLNGIARTRASSAASAFVSVRAPFPNVSANVIQA